MAAVADLKGMAEKCAAIAENAADANGFVTIRSLLIHFNACLRVRPLLVEGMLATYEGGGQRNRWLVLIDSERYQVSDYDVASENVSVPLPVRFRFTVAHELCHTLAFMQNEDAVELRVNNGDKRSRSDLVEEIERETDRLTTLLLCPGGSLEALLNQLRAPICLEDLAKIASAFGLSREALVSRLLISQIARPSDFWQRPQLKDFGVLLAERLESGEKVIRNWPVFHNFSNGILPEIIHRLRREKSVPLSSAFARGATACPTPTGRLHTQIGAGTFSDPNSQTLEIEVEEEIGALKGGAKSFLLIRSHSVHEKVREHEQLRLERLKGREAVAR